MQLKDLIRDQIFNGLHRRSIQSCSRWAEEYRVMGGLPPKSGPWRFKYYPWLRAMHDSKAEQNSGRKAAQMGYTETLLNISFHAIDILRTDVLYVLPSKNPDASDFSSARFDAALELSDHLKNLFSDTRNVGHKRAGSTNLYIRGSRSRGGLKSIPVGRLMLDEFDEMDHAQTTLAEERLSGQFNKQIWRISTPTIENFGIDAQVKISNDQIFTFQCLHCSRKTELLFPDSLVITADSLTDSNIQNSHLICKECRHPLDHKAKPDFLAEGIWEATRKIGIDHAGWNINQLYSSTISPVELAVSAIKAQYDPTDEQEFFNSKLGLPHVVKGAQVTDEDIEAAKGNYSIQVVSRPNAIVTMGVDVGSYLHCEIAEWSVNKIGKDANTQSTPRIIAIPKVQHFEDLDELMRRYQIHFCIIDMMPERRKAKEFADRFDGYVKLCFYGRGETGKSVTVKSDDIITDHQITVDRTSWLDASLGRFIKKDIVLPYNITDEYREHIKAQVRRYEKDDNGNPVGRYVSVGADHYGHARNYNEIALPFALSSATNEPIENFL